MCKSFFLNISVSIPSVSARDLTRLKAACAKRRPGQAGSHSRQAGAQRDLVEEFLRTQVGGERFFIDSYNLFKPIRDARCHTAARSSQLTLKLANPGFACVGPDNFPNCVVSKSNLSGFKTVFRNLPRNEVAFGDSQLIFL